MQHIKWLCLLLICALPATWLSATAEAGETLILPGGIDIVDEEALYGLESAEALVIPEGATELLSRAIAYGGLREVTLPRPLEFIADDALDGNPLEKLHAQAGSYAYLWAVDHGYSRQLAGDTGGFVRELYDAAGYGFPLENAAQPFVTGAEMMSLMDALVRVAAPDRVSEWQGKYAGLRAFEQPLRRFDAMAMLFLTCSYIGGWWGMPDEAPDNGAYDRLNFPWDSYYFSEGLFDGIDGPVYSLPYRGDANYLDITSLYFDLWRISEAYGQFPFALDEAANSIHENVPPSYAEAVAAAVRMIDIGTNEPLPEPDTPAAPLPVDRDAELHDDLDAAIERILNARSVIVHSDEFIPVETSTGKAYYVSADGDDDIDGLSPETAWRTIDKVLRDVNYGDPGTIQPGDAIFFRRGDIFRLPEIEVTLEPNIENLTFSAYGEGDKPIITASSENGSGDGKWQLVYSDASGKKIWQYYRDMRDTSMIVFDNGAAIANRVYEFYTGDGYVSCEATGWWMHEEEGVTLKDGLLSLEDSLTEDMTIISRPTLQHVDDRPGDYNVKGVGPLYLRCDRGNPGALYSSVEFTELEAKSLMFLHASGNVIDNISFRSNANSYIKGNLEEDDVQNTLIQNCEFAYGGGGASDYETHEDGNHVVVVQGDGIYTVVSNSTIRDNYFHDAKCSTATYEGNLENKSKTIRGYYRVLDNVMVNTIGLRLDASSDMLRYLDSVVVSGNQIWNTGRMDNGKYIYSEGTVVFMPANYGEFIVSNNVFYGTEQGHPMNALLDLFIYDYENSDYTKPQFSDNVYVQYSGRNFADFLMDNQTTWGIDDLDLLKKVAELLGDATAEVYVIQ